MDNHETTENSYLFLHPEELDGLVGMADAIDALSQAYGDANKWPIVNAARGRLTSLSRTSPLRRQRRRAGDGA